MNFQSGLYITMGTTPFLYLLIKNGFFSRLMLLFLTDYELAKENSLSGYFYFDGVVC